MNRTLRTFAADGLAECLTLVLIIGSSVSISIAEGQYYYSVIFVLALFTAIWTRRYASTPARRHGLERGQRWLAGLAVAWLIIEWFPLQRAEVVTLGHFVMLLCSIIVLSPRHTRDMTVLLILAMLLLVIGAIVSSNLGFGAAIVLYTLLYPYAVARHLLRTAAADTADRRAALVASIGATTDGPDEGSPRRGSLLWGSLQISTVALLIGVLLFLAFPRFGARIGQWRSNTAAMVTGDSTDVMTTNVGTVQLSDRPVMRVWLERAGQAVRPNAYTPYFRSAAMDRYQRRGRNRFDWTRTPATAQKSIELKSRRNLDLVADAHGLRLDESEWLDQYYEMLVRTNRRLYAVYPAMAFESPDIDAAQRTVDDQGLDNVGQRRSRGVQYMVRSPWQPSARTAQLITEQNAAARTLSPSDIRAHDIPAEIAPIARRIAGISADDGSPETRRRAAERIRDHLTGDDFQYTLQLERGPRGVDPIVHFLTTLRRGHCQYFASAMVLMCQSLGIPARVAVGYCGGDYNKVGGYYLVRESDAHAWAEVYIPGEDWVMFDPSPSLLEDDDENAWLAWIKSALQLAQYEWITRVVAFDREQRRRLFDDIVAWLNAPSTEDAAAPRGAAATAIALVRDVRSAHPVKKGLIVVGLAVAAVALYFAARRLRRAVARRRRGPGRFTRRREAAFISDALDALAKLGFRRRSSQTLLELVDSLPRGHAVRSPSHQLVQTYYRTQYGDRPLSPADSSQINAWLSEIRSADAPAAGHR